MVYDAVHNVIAEALGELDPSSRSRTSRRRTSPRLGRADNAARDRSAQHAAFLVERRVVVVRDAQSLVADEVTEVSRG